MQSQPYDEALRQISANVSRNLLLARRNVHGREKQNAAMLASVQIFTNPELVVLMFKKCQVRVLAYLQHLLDSAKEGTAICLGDVNRVSGHFAVLFRLILGVFRCEGVCVCVYIYVCVCVCVRACMRVYMCVWHIYTYIYILYGTYIYMLYIYIYIYINTIYIYHGCIDLVSRVCIIYVFALHMVGRGSRFQHVHDC